MYKPIVQNDILKYVQKENNSLYIKHYAGEVKYNVTNMVNKNILNSNNDIKKALKESSKNKLIKDLFKNENLDGHDKFINKTLTEIFRDNLNELFKKFKISNNRYIKCIKPNIEKKENFFDREIVLDQMKYGGIEAALHIKKNGFPIHIKKEDFIKEYKILFPEINKESFRETIENEIRKIDNNKFNDSYQIGKNIFFMKEELKNSLDRILNKKLKEIN